jgi:tetratricopeptide (TPR) repeat protein
MRTNVILSVLAASTIAACGGKPPKSGLKPGTDEVPVLGDVKPDDPNDKPEFTADQRADFQSAAQYFADNDKSGWNASACRGAADKFSAVARKHNLVEAQYMVGRSFHACGLSEDAEAAYQAALKMKGNHAPTISNLGELYWQAGKRDGAKDYWEKAVKADPKIVAARANLAMLMIEELRTVKNDKDWWNLEKAARIHLSSVLAVDNDHMKAYVLYGMLYMEQPPQKQNKNRLDLAKLLLDEGAKRATSDYAPLQHAYGLYFLYKNNLTEALSKFSAAVQIDGKFVEAHMNVGLITLGFRKYDVAKTHFQTVLDIQGGKNYDALIGLGIAKRGLNDLDGAEKAYESARSLDGKRGEAYFNLGVLYQDFRAAKQNDLKAAKDAYLKAKSYFQEFLKLKSNTKDDEVEAGENIKLIDKNVKQLDEFIKASASQPAG